MNWDLTEAEQRSTNSFCFVRESSSIHLTEVKDKGFPHQFSVLLFKLNP